eukprot:9160162-Alexandrium_andersonii.AAC.1
MTAPPQVLLPGSRRKRSTRRTRKRRSAGTAGGAVTATATAVLSRSSRSTQGIRPPSRHLQSRGPRPPPVRPSTPSLGRPRRRLSPVRASQR